MVKMETSKAKKKWKREYYIRNKEKYSIWAKLDYLKRQGRFKIGEECEKCGKKQQLVMHHEDYKKPFKIMVLCRFCHQKLHKST